MKMKYAQYVSETQINTTLPKKGYDTRGRLVSGNLENRPDVLELLKFYPLVEEPMPSEAIDGHHYEKRYRLDSEIVEPEEERTPTEEEVNDETQSEEPTAEEEQAAPAQMGYDDQLIDTDEPSEGESDPADDPEPEPPQPAVKYTVVQYWVSIEDPPEPEPAPRTFSKYKLKLEIAKVGLLDQFMQLLESVYVVPGYSGAAAFNDALTLDEDNEKFKDAVRFAKSELGLTDEDVEKILSASVSDL